MKKREGNPPGVIWHHSLTKDGSTKDWASIKHFHMTDPAYMMDDIGYHFGLERINGVITFLEGRPADCVGGHTKGYNDYIGVCVVGNFDLAPPDSELLGAAVTLGKNLLQMYPYMTIESFHRHSEYAKKSCPGNMFPWYDFLMKVKKS